MAPRLCWAFARKMDIPPRKKAKAIEQRRIPAGVIAPVVIVTAQVLHLPQVSEGRCARGLAQGVLEVFERNNFLGLEHQNG
jgi:hypothetical protein